MSATTHYFVSNLRVWEASPSRDWRLRLMLGADCELIDDSDNRSQLYVTVSLANFDNAWYFNSLPLGFACLTIQAPFTTITHIFMKHWQLKRKKAYSSRLYPIFSVSVGLWPETS